MRWLLSLIFAWTYTSSSLALPTISIQQAEHALGIGTEVLIDESRNLSFEAAQEAYQKGEFKPVDKVVPNYGFTGHAYWFRFKVRLDQDIQGPFFFVMENPLVDSIQVYSRLGDKPWLLKSTGDRVPFSQRDLKHRYFHFELPLDGSAETEVFARFQSLGASEFKMSIQAKSVVMAKDHESQLFFGSFIGLMLIMITYYLLMAIGAKSLEYFSMAFAWSAILFLKLVMTGLAFEYLWPNAVAWANLASSLSVPLVFVGCSFSTMIFLPLKEQQPKLYRAIYFFTVLMFSLSLASFFLPYSMIKIYIAIGSCAIITSAAASFVSFFSGYKPARFFLLSWLTVFSAALIYALQKTGFVAVNFFTSNCLELGTAAQVVLMSIGASDKVNAINRAIRQAQKAALAAQIQARELTEKMNTELESQVKARTEELWQQSKGMSVMLDSIKQGICTIDVDGKIQPQYSQFLESLLETKNLAGLSIFEVLFTKSDLAQETQSQIQTVLGFTIGNEALGFDGNAHLLPRNLRFQGQKSPRYYEIDWAPIEDAQGNTQKLLVALRDVTEVRRAEQEAANKQRELEIIGKILAIPAAKFQRFVKSTKNLLRECRDIVVTQKATQSWNILLRDIHTVKGNSRTYGFGEVSHTVHEVESELFALNPKSLADQDLLSINQGLDRISQSLAVYEIVNDQKLKRAEQAQLESSLLKLSQMVGQNYQLDTEESRQQLGQVLRIVEKFSGQSFTHLLQPLVHSLPSLANQLGKDAPSVLISGQDFYLDQQTQDGLEDVFVHLFRNSLDHGFLDMPTGEISIELLHSSDATKILYHDSGRGLPISTLRKRGIEKGLIQENASLTQVAHLIFESGISSARKITEISGRGVGMDAVKTFIQSMGGRLELELLSDDDSAECIPFQLTIFLPPKTLVKSQTSSKAA